MGLSSACTPCPSLGPTPPAVHHRFLQSDNQELGALGIGIGAAVGVPALAAAGVHNTVQLMAKFMSMFEVAQTTQERCDLFHAWLREVGVAPAFCSPITYAVARKIDRLMPALCPVRPAEFKTSETAESG